MNVGFYGHSNCAYRSKDSHIDIFAERFNANIVNIGVRQGSEERILFELKKTKNLDLAIIFHSEPQYLFLPGCDRDFGLNNVNELRIDYLFNQWNNQFFQEHHKNFLLKFKDAETFHKIISYYKEYLYHPDLQMNRFYGSLIQIDQYITSKKISCIHVINPTVIPRWFKFSSGLIDSEIFNIINKNKLKSGEWFVNCVNREGNLLIADRLTGLVENNIPLP